MKIGNGILSVFLILLASACRHPKELVYKDIQHFKLQNAGLQQSGVSLDIRMYNPNNYDMKLKDADVDVFINGNLLGKMCVNNQCSVPGLDTFLLPVTLNVDMKNAIPNAWQLLVKSDVDIKLAGTIRAGRRGIYIKVPVNYEGKQDIRSSLKW
jgi:LEA14-like dessication related protein